MPHSLGTDARHGTLTCLPHVQVSTFFDCQLLTAWVLLRVSLAHFSVKAWVGRILSGFSHSWFVHQDFCPPMGLLAFVYHYRKCIIDDSFRINSLSGMFLKAASLCLTSNFCGVSALHIKATVWGIERLIDDHLQCRKSALYLDTVRTARRSLRISPLITDGVALSLSFLKLTCNWDWHRIYIKRSWHFLVLIY